MRPRLPTILLLLLAGAVVNVGVAWGCALRVNDLGAPLHFTYSSGPDGWWTAKNYSKFGSTWISSRRERGKSDPRSSSVHPADIMPDWGLRIPTPEWEAGLLYYEGRLFEGRGWPARSMWYERSRENSLIFRRPTIVPVEGSIEIHGTAFAKTFGKRAYRLPLRIIWPGFAVNTAFYAALLWLLIPGPFTLRRLIRRRRGLCPKCCYPMGESSVCTECGVELAKRAAGGKPLGGALRWAGAARRWTAGDTRGSGAKNPSPCRQGGVEG